MKNNTIQDFLSLLGISFPGYNLMKKYANEKPPLRAELFSADQMDKYAKTLAAEHRLGEGLYPDQLLKRLADNEEVLLEVHNLLTETVKATRQITPAGEWLLDNFYLIEDQIRTGKRHLPKGYSQALPWLLNGQSKGLPRVYDIALEIISHSDGRVDATTLSSFIRFYQTVSPLKLGELWAIPIMLRLALIENLRRVAVRIAAGRIHRNLAHYWADEMVQVAEKDPKSLILVIADMARSDPPMDSSFVAELTRRLQGKGPALALPLNWMEQRLSELGQTSIEIVNLETQKLAADQVSMSNSISSLRFLATMDWREFVEDLSLVENILFRDPDGIYAKMDFPTRDSYRHVVEKVAKKSKKSEQEIASLAVTLARESAEKNIGESRTSHVGYYLIGKGLNQTEKLAQMHHSFLEWFRRLTEKISLFLYVGSITFFTFLISGAFVLKAWSDGVNINLLIAVGIISLICTSHLAVSFVNWIGTLVVKPTLLPKMDFSKGVPEEYRTLVVVPTLLSSEADIESMLEALEVKYLANKDENLYFGLLTDFKDAKDETLPEDEWLLHLTKTKIELLNSKYGPEKNQVFFLFHRPRKWNNKDKIWMGYERKRGKLTDLNSLLIEGITDNFSLIIGDPEIYTNIKYVITLDGDTQLPRDAACQLVATMAHPLNKASYSEKKKRVIDGYGILQPRVSVSLAGSNRSLYAKMHGSDAGVDPYTRAVSDLYQDLFGEGSFIGKGIYEVAMFEKVLNRRFPENRILSHDLLEGCYIRSGLVSDIQLYEEYPSKYHEDTSRRHRWIRGDWQIGNWMLPWVTGADKRLVKNPLSFLSKWKIFDNLRRSFIPIALTALLILGWSVLSSAWFWTLVVIFIIILPSLISAVWDLIKKPEDITFKNHIRFSIVAAYRNFVEAVFTILTLPYEAWYHFDAILRTNWRIIITGKKLLQWSPSSVNRGDNIDQVPRHTYIRMWISPFIGLVMLVYIVFNQPINLLVALPFLVLWILSPAITWLISRPIDKYQAALSEKQIVFLKKISRKTWSFFEKFVGPEDNWLPPDNFQEHPVPVVAHRTSPTNMGIALLANLTAYDFGYLSPTKLMERTLRTIGSMEMLERYQGHFYNWYDTQSLRYLYPRYISSVDSGNLAGHLLILRQGLLALPQQKILSPKFFDGLKTTLNILDDTVGKTTITGMSAFTAYLDEVLLNEPVTLFKARTHLEVLLKLSFDMQASLKTNSESLDYEWANAITAQIQEALEDILFFAPWLMLPDSPVKFSGIFKHIGIPTINDIARIETTFVSIMHNFHSADNSEYENVWLLRLQEALTVSCQEANKKIVSVYHLANQVGELAEMQYDFLYDNSKHLLSIGFNVEEQRKDASYYDLLASEARLAVFVGIAQGKLPQESWFALGRLLTNSGGEPILLSWSGSMFEYLMPQLIMPSYENTLLDQTNKATVQSQIDYGKQRDVPWGVSESGYNMVDANFNYQYRAFGVPGLGLKRGLGADLVVAPYATVMALMVSPEPACENLKRLTDDGFEGRFGYYEAIDYTVSRLPRGQSLSIIRSFMVHHQGMSLLSLAYLLLEQPMQKRFEAEPQFQATLLLLQERIPKVTAFYSHTTDVADTSTDIVDTQIRIITSPNTTAPEVQLLSNGRYHVMVTNAGGGYSRWKDIAVTRWREDTTRDNWGSFCYIQEEDGSYWSMTHQPALKSAKNYEVIFSQGHAEFRRRDKNFETKTEIVVSPENDIEMRRVRIKNKSRSRKVLTVTSYAEVVLTAAAADTIHPAFSNLFVQTEIVEYQHSIICTRRPRSVEEQTPWMFHLMKAHGVDVMSVSYETDRMKFIGRGNSIDYPDALKNPGTLSNTQGSVLDPVVAIRYRIALDPDQTATMDLFFGMAETREMCMGLIEKYQDRILADRVIELAWTHNQMVLRQINAKESDAQLYGRLASAIIYSNSILRADPAILIKNHRGQSALWSYSISGDLPILLLQIADPQNIMLVSQLVQAHAYWRLKGLSVDLVIWNEDQGGYRQLLQDQILGLITASYDANQTERPGGIFVRHADQISQEDRILLQTVARVIISDSNGTLSEQINQRRIIKHHIPAFIPVSLPYQTTATAVTIPEELLFFNTLGGFIKSGLEYKIVLPAGKATPAPWVNVIANPNFGTVISESGQSYTWAENAHEFRLTPWNNDPVSDMGGEAFYLRDEETGQFWSPTPLPTRGFSAYTIRHGFGYSVFEYEEDGIRSELWVYVDIASSVKFSVLKLKNISGRSRKLSATGYTELVLGDTRPKSVMHILTELDNSTGALIAKNPYNSTFNDRVVFFDVDDIERSLTGDRTEFIGRNGSLQKPDALSRIKLSGKTGAAMDPCAALQVNFDLTNNQEKVVVFRLGSGRNEQDASNLVRQFRGLLAATQALEKVHQYWAKALGTIQIETPDQSLNTLTNGWLLYQTIACRLWARSGFYQSGGAFGFRDQLQDVMAVIHSEPGLVREQILLCASRQFREGDVQHWWHPPTGRGVRTRCSDDFLWLPFVTGKYVLSTGDTDLLDQQVQFLEGRPLNYGEESYYDLPVYSDDIASVYEHCVRAIQKGLSFGKHGLPLIGSGDWNDGMDMVGRHGKGESVWLGFFLYYVLKRFVKIARLRNDDKFADECENRAEELRVNIDQHSWDGNWYRRAYFDDGTPLGSAVNMECQIDSIAQSWSVLSGAGDPKRSSMGMEAVNERLVRRDIGLIQLLDPPFDKSDLNPGYIKGYVPGVRENGGQYTHAAIWMIMAFAEMGNTERAWELFDMVNPVNHGSTENEMMIYKVEPYVVAADVYASPQHKGRGGWTWYTGSAGWMYQLIIESLLGLKLETNKLTISPRLPKKWNSIKINYKHLRTSYNITIEQTDKIAIGTITENGNELPGDSIILIDDLAEHNIEIKIAEGKGNINLLSS